MYPILIQFHSALRYFVLLFLLIVIVRGLIGWLSKGEYSKQDERLGTWLVILTHAQFVLGLVLYFISPFVVFSGSSMGDSVLRYWLVEHASLMIIAIALITAARATSKRMTDATSRHKRMFLFNIIALIIILVAIGMSGRGFFGLPG